MTGDGNTPNRDDLDMMATRAREAGEVLMGRYEVLGILGRGGMGEVLHVLDRISGVDLALKRIPEDVGRLTAEVENLRKSFGIVQRLAHPGIASYRTLERDPDTGMLWLLMEYVPGVSLAVKLQAGILAQDVATRLLAPVAAALEHAHAEGVLHRDIKPSNVMVTPDGRAKLIDFGLAAEIRSTVMRVSLEGPGRFMQGTWPYMAPELWRGRPPGPSADQWALACTLYEAVAGYPPWVSDDVTILSRCIQTEEVERPDDVDDGWWEAMSRALDKDPKRRFRTCGEFARALAGNGMVASGGAEAGVAAQTPMVATSGARPGLTGAPSSGTVEDRVRVVEVRASVDVLRRRLEKRVFDLLPDMDVPWRTIGMLVDESQGQGAQALPLLDEARRRLEDLDRRCGEVEAERARAAAAAKAKADAEAARRKAEEDEKRRLAEAEAARRKAEEDEKRRVAEAEAKQQAAAEAAAEAVRKAAAEEKRREDEAEAKRLKAEQEQRLKLKGEHHLDVANRMEKIRSFPPEQTVVQERGIVFQRIVERFPPAAILQVQVHGHRVVNGLGEPVRELAEFAPIPTGRFLMGANPREEGWAAEDGPRREIQIAVPFEMMRTPVTGALFQSVMGYLPARCAADSKPVANVSWYQSIDFCNRMSRLAGLPEAYELSNVRGKPESENFEARVAWKGPDTPGYRLPTEQEWEYACRAGSEASRYGPLDEIGWHSGNSGGEEGNASHVVASLLPNVWGLFDMLGNVWEWCWDEVVVQSVVDGKQVALSRRINRGGSWRSDPSKLRAARRDANRPDERWPYLGFRVARSNLPASRSDS